MYVGYQTAFTESVIRARRVRCTVKVQGKETRRKRERGARNHYPNEQVRELPNRI